MAKGSLYFVAGEASGDVQAAEIISALRKQRSDVYVYCMGGEHMERAGAQLDMHYKDLAVMGLFDVLRKLPKIRRAMRNCLENIRQSGAKVVVLVDYPGFNLRLARKLKNEGFTIAYFIPPKIWAWNYRRIKKIIKYVDQVYSILPFEKEIYDKEGISCHYLGNPLYDKCAEIRKESRISEEAIQELPEYSKTLDYIALLPGSRVKEVERILPAMISLAEKHSDLHFKISAMSNLDSKLYHPAVEAGLELVIDSSYELLANAKAAVIASGTASLEASLLMIPHVVVYRIDALSYFLAKRLVKLSYISLVNLVLNVSAVPELIQQDCNASRMEEELNAILNETGAARQKDYFKLASDMLGPEGVADRLAHELLSLLQ